MGSMGVCIKNPPPPNPFADANTKLLLHFDEDPFEDSSNEGHTIEMNDIVRSSNQYKFGNYSALFDGASFISVPNNEDWRLRDYDFTISFWLYLPALLTENVALVSHYENSQRSWAFLALADTARMRLVSSATGGTTGTKDFNDWPSNVGNWQHIAFVRQSGTITAYADGVAFDNETSGTFYAGSAKLKIGRYRSDVNDNQLPAGSYIDEFYFVNGTAVWTSNFTPPTAPYVVI